jgi:hypothetical protein
MIALLHPSSPNSVSVSNGACHAKSAQVLLVCTSGCAQRTSGGYRVRAVRACGTARGIGTAVAGGCVETPGQREAPAKQHVAWARAERAQAGDAGERETRTGEGRGWTHPVGE